MGINYNILVVYEDNEAKLSCTANEIISASMGGIPIFLATPKIGFEWGGDVENELKTMGYPDNDISINSTSYLGACRWLSSDQKFSFTFGETTYTCTTLNDYPVYTE